MKFKSNAKYGKPIENGTIFEGKVGDLRITIHRINHCEGWFLSCYNMQIQNMQLKNDTLMGAIEESKEVLKNKVEKLRNDVKAFYESDIEVSK